MGISTVILLSKETPLWDWDKFLPLIFFVMALFIAVAAERHYAELAKLDSFLRADMIVTNARITQLDNPLHPDEIVYYFVHEGEARTGTCLVDMRCSNAVNSPRIR